MINLSKGQTIARYDLSDVAATGQVMAILRRSGSGWELRAIGEPLTGKEAVEMVPGIQRLI